jgi:transcriptional regulator with XRE-family HTH domain
VTTPYEQDTIGPLLARLRQARGYSQLNLAQLLCAASGHPTISRHEVSRWEREERIPSEFWLRPLAQVLAVPIDALRAAIAAARDTGRTGHQEPDPVVTTWLALHHGPRELLIALGGVEVDQIRTVLAPLHPPSDPPTSVEVPE